VLLIVDAQEGPMPQTRFVLKKSLALGLKPILVINKIDKIAANPEKTLNKVFELFVELGATNEQLDFPVIYAIGREGVAKREIKNDSKDITPLLDMILEKVPPSLNKTELPLTAQPFNLAYDNFLGRIAIARVYNGKIKSGDTVYVKKPSGENSKYKITKLFTFKGMTRTETNEIQAGDIGLIVGIPDIYIGDTITDNINTPILKSIAIDEPTIELTFLVNNSPFAGREGKYVTSRQIRERLEKELEVNVGLKVDFDTESSEKFTVYGRGELHIAILLENMRREGYELQVSQPRVIIKEINGQKNEPFEEVVIDVPEKFQGTIIERLGIRAAQLKNIEINDGRSLMTFECPSRGLFGYRTRGELYIKENTEVYEGMVIGNTSKYEQMTVNPTKGKQLTNMRAAGSDDAIKLIPPKIITIETGLEIMANDEYLEITPKSTRLRKQYLTETERAKSKKVK